VAEGVSLGEPAAAMLLFGHFGGRRAGAGDGHATGGGHRGGAPWRRCSPRRRPRPRSKVELSRVGRRVAIICPGAAGLIFLTGLLSDKPAERCSSLQWPWRWPPSRKALPAV